VEVLLKVQSKWRYYCD